MGYSVGMCSRRFRLMLALCLAWALPLQGLAAARMLWCHGPQMPLQMQASALVPGASAAALAAADVQAGPQAHQVHLMQQAHQTAEAPVAPAPHAPHAAHTATADVADAAMAGQAPCHDGTAATASPTSPPAAGHAADDASTGCAHCAACTLGAALPAAVPLLPGHASAHQAVTARPGAQAPAFLTGGPERPPRTPHA